MKIGIDLRRLEEEKISGIGEYALELVKNILEIDKKNDYCIFSNSFKRKNDNFSFFGKYPNAKLRRFRIPNKLLNFCLWYLGWPKLDKLIGGVDIFFSPNINFLSVSRKCRLVATFHDLSFERLSEFYSLKTRLWHYFFVNPRQIAKKADRIIAVSDSTKNDLKELYKLRDRKIHVVSHGISPDFRVIQQNNPNLHEVRKKYVLPQDFILFIGNIEPRKNVLALIGAYKNLIKNNPKLEKYKLVLVGNVRTEYRPVIENEKNYIQACGYVDRKDRPFLYNLASLFVYPSFFEGFGLPILEAMACGIPVITSQNSSMPEVGKSATILLDPSRPQQFSKAIESVISDKNLFQRLSRKGIARSQQFNWIKCARETLNIFNDNCDS